MAAIGAVTGSGSYIDVAQRHHEHTMRLTKYFESYDLLLTPTLPPKSGEFDLPKLLIKLAAQLEAAAPWAGRQPTL